MEVTKGVIHVLLLLILHTLKLSTADCQARKCEQSSGSFGQTGIKHRAILGHSFKNFTVKKTFDCHVKCFDERCRCKAYQMWNNRCELLDEDRSSAPDDFTNENGYTYFDMDNEVVSEISVNNACSDQTCVNQCCNQSPCANGGTCTELCDHVKHKFNCTCTAEFYGKLCKKRRPTSCKDQLEKDRGSQSGLHLLFDSTSTSLYEVFCDYTSENGFIWTLIESFLLANKIEFANKAFYKDYPINQNSFTWDKFRLSWSRMNFIASHSTHVRATCNFNTDGLNYTDYLRAKLSDIDVMSLNFDGCKRYEYINIRGYNCHNCTAHFVQRDYWHAHVDSYSGSQRGCQFNSPLEGAVKMKSGEDNFGWYETVNRVHRCSASANSTTQWWIGEQ